MGPHQAAFCELIDNKDGTFNLGIKAQEPGKHVLEVKYGGENVQGELGLDLNYNRACIFRNAIILLYIFSKEFMSVRLS